MDNIRITLLIKYFRGLFYSYNYPVLQKKLVETNNYRDVSAFKSNERFFEKKSAILLDLMRF